MLQLTALCPPFSEASLAVFMCTGPGSKADVVPAGPVIPLLSGVVVQLALQCNKKIRVTPWSNSRSLSHHVAAGMLVLQMYPE